AGSFDRSEEMSGLEDSEVAPGTDGRMIVRRKVPGSPQDRIPRYHVWVFAEDGGKVTDYEYSIPNWSYTKISELPPSFWSQAVRQTTGGRLFQAVMTPSLSGICTLLTRYLHQSYGFQESVFDDLALETSLWKSLPLSALLAVLVGASSRRRATTWVAPAVWSIFVLAFGLAAALVYAMLFGREWKTRCPGCAASISSQFITCPRCSAPAEEPRRLGIEIIQPSGPAPLK
ncbi:MAG TPA: hypothetical protein VMU54_01920, partial [Planctomycetota bacterium]|nr:hypothetical protein [Planctomycetota bacterium]